MKDAKTNNNQTTPKSSNAKAASAEVEVLYQKMGNRWFAFSLVNNEVFVGSISQAEIDALEAGQNPVHKLVGNS